MLKNKFGLVSSNMGWSKIYLMFTLLCTLTFCFDTKYSYAQTLDKEYTRLEDALKEPDKVIRLNLENQANTDVLKQIYKFKNLEYLNLRHTGINALPDNINALKNLKVLDLGDNNLTILPKSFSDLKNLTELYLDHEKDLKLGEDFEILSRLQSLRILHLENNNITKLPKNLNKLK